MTNRIIDFNDEKRRTSVGLSGLGRQIYRRTAQKGYDFTLMVCGEQGLGKTTLLETLFDTTSTESTLNTSTLVACSQPLRAVDEDEGHAVATSPLASDTTPRVHVRPTTMRIRDHGMHQPFVDHERNVAGHPISWLLLRAMTTCLSSWY
eukprot:m.320851 g.320851  ORF g.320851 m.320851 type:complete len:149 (-) comp20326_c0_seq11:2915-3361(-)